MTSRLCTLGLAIFLATCLSAQTSAPGKLIGRDDLLQAVKAKMATVELVQHIERQGVNFLLTYENRKMFVDAKADPRILEAVAAYFRIPESKCPECRKVLQEPPYEVFMGPPLSKAEVLILLQAKVSLDRLELIIDKRDVCFQLSPEIAKEVIAAGGSKQLNGTITLNFQECGPPKAEVKTSVPTPEPPLRTGSAPGGNPPMIAYPDSPVHMDWNAVVARRTKSVLPVYPREASQRKLSGAVNIRILIGVNGKTRSVQILDGLALLRDSAAEAVGKWEYSPFIVNGHSVEITTEVTINFKP